MGQADSYRSRYEHWVRCYGAQLFQYAYRFSGNREVAEDLVQETFTEAWKSIASQRDPDAARGWLFQILRHRQARWLRGVGSDRATVNLPENSDDHPAESGRSTLQTLADQDALQAALQTLSPPIRLTFLMVSLEGLTCRETAQVLHVPLGTVLSRLDSARRALRKVLTEPGPA